MQIDRAGVASSGDVLVVKRLGVQLLSFQFGAGFTFVLNAADAAAAVFSVFALAGQTGNLIEAYDENGNVPNFAVTGDGSVMMTTLPTGDPHVAGQLWNSAGTVKVSAG